MSHTLHGSRGLRGRRNVHFDTIVDGHRQRTGGKAESESKSLEDMHCWYCLVGIRCRRYERPRMDIRRCLRFRGWDGFSALIPATCLGSMTSCQKLLLTTTGFVGRCDDVTAKVTSCMCTLRGERWPFWHLAGIFHNIVGETYQEYTQRGFDSAAQSWTWAKSCKFLQCNTLASICLCLLLRLDSVTASPCHRIRYWICLIKE